MPEGLAVGVRDLGILGGHPDRVVVSGRLDAGAGGGDLEEALLDHLDLELHREFAAIEEQGLGLIGVDAGLGAVPQELHLVAVDVGDLAYQDLLLAAEHLVAGVIRERHEDLLLVYGCLAGQFLLVEVLDQSLGRRGFVIVQRDQLVDADLRHDIAHERGRLRDHQLAVFGSAALVGLDDRAEGRRVDELDETHVEDQVVDPTIQQVFDLLHQRWAVERVELALERQGGVFVVETLVDLHSVRWD